MQYRNLGRTGLKVSGVSLGSWLTFGTTVAQGDTDPIVRRAFDLRAECDAQLRGAVAAEEL